MLKKFIIFFIVCCSFFIHAEESNQRKFDIAIGLGGRCQVAYNLQKNGLRQQAFPFDWLITPFEGLIRFLAYQGRGFTNKENFLFHITAYNVPTAVMDTMYGFCLLHDFDYSLIDGIPTVKRFHEVEVRNYDEIKFKYDRRIKRFFEVLNSDKKVLLVRLGITYHQAVFLDEFIHSHYPNLDYLILAVDDSEEIKTDWGLTRVKNVYAQQVTYWQGREDVWKAILDRFEFSFERELPEVQDDHFHKG
jgi:hypothetical protein